MKTLKNIGVVHDTDYAKFPEGAILNETDVNEGTPVVREVYNDLLANIYAFLTDRGVSFNQLEDNELNGYQLIQALKHNVNVLNDVEKTMSLNTDIFQVSLDLTLIPEKYFCFVKASAEIDLLQSYGFQNISGGAIYPFVNSTKFKVGDELLLIIESTGVRYFNISNSATSSDSGLIIPFGTPIQYTERNSGIWYLESGKIFTDKPEVYDVQETIRTFENNSTILVYEAWAKGAFVLVMAFNPTNNEYSFWKFSRSDFNVFSKFTTIGFNFGLVSDFGMHAFFDGTNLYFTNDGNLQNIDSLFAKVFVNFNTNVLFFLESIDMERESIPYAKTTNTIIYNDKIYYLVNGILTSAELIDLPTYTDLFDFNSFVGNIFMIDGKPYYSNGETAVQWQI